MTLQSMLPSGVNKPWAESNRYKISELIPFIAAGPPAIHSPSLPFCVRFKIRLQPMVPITYPATLDTGPLAKSYPRGISPRLSIRPCQSARSPFGYFVFWENRFGSDCIVWFELTSGKLRVCLTGSSRNIVALRRANGNSAVEDSGVQFFFRSRTALARSNLQVNNSLSGRA